jgi:hypothetical protein
LEFRCCFWENLADLGVVVQTDILIAYILKDLAGKFFALVALCVDKVAEIASGAACWTMKVLARNSSVVSRLNQLVWIWWRV